MGDWIFCVEAFIGMDVIVRAWMSVHLDSLEKKSFKKIGMAYIV